MELNDNEKDYLKKLKPVDKMYKGELSKEILRGVSLGGAVAAMIIMPGSTLGFKWVKDLHDNHKRRFSDNLNRLEKRGYVKADGHGNYFVTSKGHLKLNEYRIKDLKVKIPKIWDKKWRIISFDIPEEKKKARMALNKKLKEMKFQVLQKSVFVYPHPCEKEFLEIGDFFGVKNNIVFIEANKISNEEKLIKKFKEDKII